ncbi:Bug family tripartite tricarboxylate transporter substrate binding protein [Sabulicella glaciei]|uniref:Tripartite tricarboxylate transporter substrate binding protein n=1 Tax=Sabulicella glaciei TaxID=2984948 RepID=A0ABT3NY96_9PROT|nr:tripartite tricarboxylate transporter substrate binding protein [Roseococcus sp. MDT2-1-1]MCW8087135.1 tripartite tricarboxylate transporter substrate binding protein [Roseococcus sp. MDT2-1-1]
MTPRRALLLAPLAAPLAAPALAQQAEWRPSRPVTLVVPFAAGSGTDAVARILAQMLSQEMGGATITVDNRAGANGTIAARAVMQSPPDGQTLFVTTNTTHAANPWLLKRLDYDPINDFTPISRLGNYVFWLAVNPEVPARNLRELMALAKARPGQISYASGNGTGIVAGATIARMGGVEMLHVPYRSTPPAITDLLAGRVQSMVVDLTPSQGHVRDGRLRALGVTSGQRSALIPDVPTLAEEGLPGFDLLSFAVLLGPARMAPEATAAYGAAMRRVGAKPEYRSRLAEVGFDGMTSTPEEVGTFIREQIAAWGEMIRGAGIEPE